MTIVTIHIKAIKPIKTLDVYEITLINDRIIMITGDMLKEIDEENKIIRMERHYAQRLKLINEYLDKALEKEDTDGQPA